MEGATLLWEGSPGDPKRKAASSRGLFSQRPRASARGLAHNHTSACVGWNRNEKSTGLAQFWANFRPLIGILSQTAGPTCEFWAGPVSFDRDAREDVTSSRAALWPPPGLRLSVGSCAAGGRGAGRPLRRAMEPSTLEEQGPGPARGV
jgi:hypothetical protein